MAEPHTGASPAARRTRKALVVPAIVAAILAIGACGGNDAPLEVQLEEKTADQTVLGFPALATKNTTRVGGEDPVADAAGTAAAAFPGQTRGTRPRAVTLVDQKDWHAGIAAASLMARPLGAPILLTDGGDLSKGTSTALETMRPTGAKALGGAQAIEVGRARAPDGLRSRSISGGDPAKVAAGIDAVRTTLAGKPSANVVIVSADQPQYAMPAAAWAAKSGDAVLFTERNELPSATRQALGRHEQPGIYVLGPPGVISTAVERSLRRLGRVRRIQGRNPVANAIAFARYSDAVFGWGVRDPGHGLVFAKADRTQDAAAAAALGGSGKYGPLLLLQSADTLPPQLQNYLLDIQPGYRFDPVRGVYNHAWILGDESAISLGVQARIDELAEIVRVRDEGL
jgi:putative cell wall-binding protein